MKLLVYTIGGQEIGFDIQTWDDQMLSGNTAFMAIADTGSTPTNYVDVSSIVNWDRFGSLTTLTDAEIKNEILKLIPDVPTQDQYQILENYMNVGINNMTNINGLPIYGGELIDGNALTGVTTAYGSYYQYAASLSASTTNSVTGVTKVELTTTNLKAGTYKISCCWIWNRSTATSNAYHEIWVNDVPQGQAMIGRMQVNTEYRPSYKVSFLQLSGVNTIKLVHYGSTPQQITTTTDASIELIRVK